MIGIDHVYVAVRDMRASEIFYDRVMTVLGLRRREAFIGGDPHVLYHNRHFGYAIRPAREDSPDHDPYAPGLHHFCFRVVDEAAVDRVAEMLREEQIGVTQPRYYPEYGSDYYATFFEDPDGMRLEITNFRESRRKRMFDWEHAEGPDNDQ